ncbi:MAG TPA: hypothetical protein VFK13_05415 [Gemmatimonadaceae bacterium]|nr:hypothetical protein [Gemmatimonadaceae bacterium]
MIVDLRKATVAQLARAIFDHPTSDDLDEAWYSGDVAFAIEPERQLRLITELFHGAPVAFSDYSAEQIEAGLWCMMGGVHPELLCGLIWDRQLPFDARRELVQSIYPLYDQVLAPYPYDEIDFGNPDDSNRRFRTIDYMAPDLLLDASSFRHEDADDAALVRGAFLDLFTRLLAHDAPVAQYAALHGLGHLQHERRAAAIQQYLDSHAKLDPGQRDYAERASRGAVL